MNFKPVFLCGHPRSGTTLLSRLLDNHSQLSVFPEETLYRKWSKLTFSSPSQCVDYLEKNTLVGHLNKDNEKENIHKARGIIKNANFQYDTFIENFKSKIPGLKTTEIYENLHYAYIQSHFGDCDLKNIQYFVEKTPANESRLHSFFNSWSDAKAVYIYRHPLDVIYSHSLKNNQWHLMDSSDFIRRVINWKNSLQAIRKSSIRYPDKILIIGYEDLISNTRQMMKNIADFLNISEDESLLKPTYMGKDWIGVSSNDSNSEVIKSNNSNWHKVIPDEYIHLAHLFLYKELFFLGYRPLINTYPSKKDIIKSILKIPSGSYKKYLNSIF